MMRTRSIIQKENNSINKVQQLKTRIHGILLIAIVIDVLISIVTIYVDYISDRSVGDITLNSLNYYEYCVLTPLFVGSYIFIYRRLSIYHQNMIIKYNTLLSEEEIRILHQTNWDILVFFLCVSQYLIMRVIRVILALIAFDRESIAG